jgi:hypothetical protein
MSDQRSQSGTRQVPRRMAGRAMTVVLSSVVIAAFGATPAFARPAPANPPAPTGTMTVDASTGAVTVDATGTWSWAVGTNTKGGEVNATITDKCGGNFGVGWAIAWGDASDPGTTIRAHHNGQLFTAQVGTTADTSVHYDTNNPCGSFSPTALTGQWTDVHTYPSGTPVPKDICVVSYILKNKIAGHHRQYKVNTNHRNSFKKAVKLGNGATWGTSSACFDPSQLKASPTIVTTATNAQVGSAIADTATLSGTTQDLTPGAPNTNAGGTVTFNLYGPTDTNCTSTPVFTSSALVVSGDGTYGPASFTPTQGAGTYRWIATYSGDPANNGATELCGASGETSTVTTTAATNPTNPSTTPGTSVPIVTTGTPTNPGSGSGSKTASLAVTGATTVHTGEPWAGSRPFVIAMVAFGISLMGLGYFERRRTAVRKHAEAGALSTD